MLRHPRPFIVLPLLAGAGFILCYWAFGATYLDGFRLDVGSVHVPTARYTLMAFALVALGVAAVLCLVTAGMRLVSAERLVQWRLAWAGFSDSRSLLLAGCFGTLIPLAIQSAVLGHAPVADDEASYRFAAQLLASFRLWSASPPMKLFFDNGFLINDGRMYSQYFLGWPFLLAFGEKVGVPWLVNPLLSGATAVGIFQVSRFWWGSAWARVASLLYISSPFLMTGAATLLSHTALVFAICWMLYAIQRVARGTGAWASALVALCFCLAIWTRPASAVGLGVPFLLMWASQLWRMRPAGRVRHAVAFALVAGALAALFLATNQVLYGSPLLTGYHAGVRYAQQNGFRFVSFSPSAVKGDSFWYFFVNRSPVFAVANLAAAFLRLNVDGFGWPLGLSAALLARSRNSRWLAASAAAFCLTHFSLADAGIDSFGPVHYLELMLPLVLLTTDGLRTVWRWSNAHHAGALMPCTLGALLLTAATMYLPSRWLTLSRLSRDVNAPRELVEREAPHHSVIFVSPPLTRPCASFPARSFVFFRPNNSPDLDDDVLWVNHISIERDREFIASHPGRKGFMLAWQDSPCGPVLVPLELAQPDHFPPTVREMPTDFPEVTRQQAP